MNKKDICEVFKVLTLFFALTVISIVMVHSKFEEGVERFWQEQEEIKAAVNEISLEENKNEEKCKMSEGVYDFRQYSPLNIIEEKCIFVSNNRAKIKGNSQKMYDNEFDLVKG